MTEALPPKKLWFVEIRSKILREVDFLRILHTVICVKDIVEIRTYDECLSPVVIFDGFLYKGN